MRMYLTLEVRDEKERTVTQIRKVVMTDHEEALPLMDQEQLIKLHLMRCFHALRHARGGS